MNTTTPLNVPSEPDHHHQRTRLRHAIEHAAHLLPTQAPIQVFVHHNTLHSYEDLSFHEGVQRGSQTYGCNAYLPEHRYRQKLARGRILPSDLSTELLEDLGDEADRLVGVLGTRYRLRMAMLEHPLLFAPDPELHWLIDESDALRKFRPEASASTREQMVNHTRYWVMHDLRDTTRSNHGIRRVAGELLDRFGRSDIEGWSDEKWTAMTLHLLWEICLAGTSGVLRPHSPSPPHPRLRDQILEHGGLDPDTLVHDVLIRFCAAYLDQGIAHWPLPNRELGFFRCFATLFAHPRPVERWMHDLPKELKRIEQSGTTPLDSIVESLRELGIQQSEEEDFLTHTLLALRGWAGMVYQLETNCEWAVHPAPAGSLVEYLAVRLLLERLALVHIAREEFGYTGPLSELREKLNGHTLPRSGMSVQQRAFTVLQLAQTVGWKPFELYRLSNAEWAMLVDEIERFSEPERRRIYHLAFERRFRNQVFDAVLAHYRRATPLATTPTFQVICCIDEREESFRRHLEEVAPECETFGVAGFFGVAMYYRGVLDAHYVPLCPVVVKPQHYVQEEVIYSFEESYRRRVEARRALGKASHRVHGASRSIFEGWLTAVFGSLASVPLVARVLFPRLTARIRKLFGTIVQAPPITRLLIERTDSTPGPKPGELGYSTEEMIAIAKRVLSDIGLTSCFSRLIFIMGHGSSSLNNPHKSAYDCGACGGGRGGPNARAFAAMLNDPRVRDRLVADGMKIPRDTVFIGANHNTCDDSITCYDLDRLPSSHRYEFELARKSLDEARRRNAHERCRRFESAELNLTPEAALRHVESRSEDLSQTRPECGHATNAMCIIGRRERTRGLFLDRRSFLNSYDPTQDNESHDILTRILQAVFPVCAGISLEYYFCYVDPTGYGCGSKLPHNITSLIGVMDGAASDLRPGLPWQMVEIHEPVRCLFVIECTPAAMLKILERNPALDRLVRNEWVQLGVLDPRSPQIHVYHKGKFDLYHPESNDIPVVKASPDWYRGWRDHLGFASVIPNAAYPNSMQEHVE